MDAEGFVDVEFSSRVARVRSGDTAGPAVWLGHSGEDGRDPEWYGAVVGEFLEVAALDPVAMKSRPLGSDRPLFGFPLMGVGAGGMAAHKGEVVEAIMRRTRESLAHLEVDAVLVLLNDEGFSAAQKARASVFGGDLWADLSVDDEAVAQRLISSAREGALVPFIGAGVSIGAGAPSWGGLLSDLADAAGVAGDELQALDARDAAAVLEKKLKRGPMVQQIVDRTTLQRVSLLHQLIASLPVEELVTTNYDRGIEDAMEQAGRPLGVLPREELGGRRRWLLKLHGSIDDRDRIVLSRDDSLRFEGSGAALAGIVQALLLTRHILFVGYSLSDDKFHRLVHQVRSAVGPAQRQPYGTALTPQPLGLMADVWRDDVNYASTATDGVDDPRRLAVLLDRVVAGAAAPAAHLLDQSYDAVFGTQERELRDRLRHVWELVAEPSDLPEDVRVAVGEALGHIADFRRVTSW